MVETSSKRPHTEHALLDIGVNIGALVIYTRFEALGKQIEVSPLGEPGRRTHTEVLERRAGGLPVYAALFQALPEGDYEIWGSDPDPIGEVTITGGLVAEINWRHLYLRAQTPGMPVLPPRYRDTSYICAAPMAAAPLLYDSDGKVAWDRMWTDFCDLALAGGPPHRGSLLEPVSPEEVQEDPEGYERVLAEIERGLRLVTGRPTIRCASPGWIGLQCSDEEMAVWLLRAIVVENVSVRREGRVLYLPVGPAFQLEKEIKNVITVVAKTNHYWIEHIQ